MNMGAWGYKAFDNDQTLDCISFVENANKEVLPFVTYQLLHSRNADESLLGVIIVTACKVNLSKRMDLLSESCYGNDYKRFFSKIYKWATTDKDFNEFMFHWCNGYVDGELYRLKQIIHHWVPEVQKDRLKYLDELTEINKMTKLPMITEE